jgi:hypothetical protein
VRKGIDTLRRRIEKHFGDVEGESANVSRNLVGFVCAEAQKCYEGTLERTERLMAAVYPNAEGEKNVEIDFGREDIKSGFRRWWWGGWGGWLGLEVWEMGERSVRMRWDEMGFAFRIHIFFYGLFFFSLRRDRWNEMGWDQKAWHEDLSFLV